MLGAEQWGKGYATEIALALVDAAFFESAGATRDFHRRCEQFRVDPRAGENRHALGGGCTESIAAPRIVGGTATCSPCRASVGGLGQLSADRSLTLGLVLGRCWRALRGAFQHLLARQSGIAAAAQRQQSADQYGGNDYDNDDGSKQ